MGFEPVVDAFMSRREWQTFQDASYPYGDERHYALAFIPSEMNPGMFRYAWHDMTDSIVVYMRATCSPHDAFIVQRLNYLSSKLGMEPDAFRMRYNNLCAGKAKLTKLMNGDDILEWRPGMTSIDQLLAYRMMTEGR